MSVNKFIINKKNGNFTVLSNNVLQNLHDYEALGLYCYLSSLPHEWEFYKEQLRKHGDCGKEKINKLLKILEVHELIKITQNRLENGQFGTIELEVFDGTNFKINDLQKFESPFTEKPLTANRLPVTGSYKRNIDKTNINKKEKEKISCSSDDERISFERFWSLYPRRQNKKGAFKTWVKNNLIKIVDKIESHLMNRIENEWRGRDIKYIPLPTTFLNGERWNDDIVKKNTSVESANKSINGRDVSMNYFKELGLL